MSSKKAAKSHQKPGLHGGLPAEKLDWEKVAWEIVLSGSPIRIQRAESLMPTIGTVERALYARGEVREAARAILDSWKFRALEVA
jgi:hypothetical protein